LKPELRSGQVDRVAFRKDTKIEVIIPTLNEERTLGAVINDIRSSTVSADVSISVIDGGSTDRTTDICKAENVKYILQKTKGKGSAMREAVDQSDADIVVFIDGDGTYSASDLKSMLEPLLNDQADMVVGSRVWGKREKGAITHLNTLGNKLFNKTINFAMKTSITDSLSGYRALYRKTFKELVLFSESFEIEVEMTVEALAKGYRVLEVPIRYGLRNGTRTKLDPIGDGLRIGRTLLFILMNVNPLKFFGIISIAFFVAGLYPGILVLYEKITTGNILSMPSVVFSSLLFVTGTISIVVGMVSELVVRSRRRLEYLINRKIEGKT
jgi:glycosyltransferase involved in cell wall biosynthesis